MKYNLFLEEINEYINININLENSFRGDKSLIKFVNLKVLDNMLESGLQNKRVKL